MENLVETLAIGLLVSVILIVISWWFWKRYDEPSEAQIEREESIAKKQEETRMWRAVEAQMAEEKVAFEEQALYDRRKAEERARAVPPPTGEVSNAFAAFDMERQTPVKTFTEHHEDAPSAEAALIGHELEIEVDDDDARYADELVEVRQDQGVVFEEHQTLPELPANDETIEVPDAVDAPVPAAPDLETLTQTPLESVTQAPLELVSEPESVTQAPLESVSEPELVTQTAPESTSELEWSPDDNTPVEADWSDNWFSNLDDE